MQEPWKIAIIGAGFSGVMSAVQLLREAGDRPVQIYLVNRGGRMARGVAYGTRSPVHMLNVPAGRMSALPDEPEHFLRFAQSRDAGVTPTIKLTKEGKFKGGVDGIFNVKSGGVGYGKVSTTAPNRAALIAVLNKWAKDIADGKVKFPTTVK